MENKSFEVQLSDGVAVQITAPDWREAAKSCCPSVTGDSATVTRVIEIERGENPAADWLVESFEIEVEEADRLNDEAAKSLGSN